MVADWYAGATAGIGGQSVYLDNDNHKSFSAQSFGAVIGVDLPVVRFEGEYNYLNSDEMDLHLVMGNAYVKLLGAAIVNPYIGVGVGVMVDGDTKYDVDLDTAVAYQGMLGATFNIPVLPLKIDLEARALLMPDLFSVGKEDVDALHYDARVKLRYVF